MSSLSPVLVAWACALASPVVAGAQAAPAPAPGPRPRLALALSGGGARGIAHIGALRALEEAGIPVDAIAANSMGAVVGGIYATGRTTSQLEATVRGMDWADLFSGRPDRRALPVARRKDRFSTLFGIDFGWKSGLRLPESALSEHRIDRFLIEQLAPAGYAAGGDFDRLPIPFRAVAGALDNGERVVLADGDLALAVRASMSIPLLFPPVEWKGRRLVDGVIVDNLPVDVARQFGAPVVVAVDISSPDLSPDEYRDAVGIAAQLGDVLADRRNADFAAPADVCVRPDLGEHKATDYSGFDELIEKGYEAMKAALPRIREKLAEAGIEPPYAPRAPASAVRQLDGTPIAEVAIAGNERLSQGFLRAIFNVPLGPPFELARALRAFERTDALGYLDHVWMEFEPEPSGLKIVLRVREAAPNRVEVGAAYTSWERARGTVRLRNYNTLGFGEETELLLSASDADSVASLSLRGERLLFVGLGYEVTAYAARDRPRFFDASGDTINRARFDRRGLDARLQLPLKRWGLVEAGARFGRVETIPEAGIDLPEAEDGVGTLEAGLILDDLDDLLWPQSGRRLAVTGEWSLGGLGATYPGWRLQAEARTALAFTRRTTLQLDGRLGLSHGDVPVYDWYRIGGPYLVPGYHHEELKGAQALAAALSLRFRIAKALHLVTRAGAGNVFESQKDLTLRDLRYGVGVGLMAPTRVGPVSVELGVRDGGESLVTLSLGWN
jgi:NTE family protein